MNKFFLFPLLVLTLMLVNSCKKDPEFIIAEIELDDEFEISLHEDWTATDTELFLKIRSSKIYSCDNLGLKSSLVKTLDNKLIINIQEVIVNNEDCEGMEAAQGFIKLGTLVDGNYDIEIALLGQLKSKGTLQITSNRYSLNLNEDAGIKVKHPIIYKTPTKTLFGFILAKDANDQNMVSNVFIDSMEVVGTPFENSGIYGRFEVRANGDIVIQDTSEDQIGDKLGFAITSNEDPQEIIDQIPTSFCIEGHTLKIVSTNGLTMECN